MRCISGQLQHRRWWLFIITIGCALAAILAASSAGLRRRFAAEMMVRAVKTDEPELEGSTLLSSSIEHVKNCLAQDEAVTSLIPLINAESHAERLRARFCLIKLNGNSPPAISALIELYRDVRVPYWNRIEVAGMLTWLAPQFADESGAAAVVKQYYGRRINEMDAEDRQRLAEEILRKNRKPLATTIP